ncbi:MAG TPA: glycosyltransferase [Bacteroidia bacterium]
MKPTVSILIPAFNAYDDIFFALESCIQQTYSDFEVIILSNLTDYEIDTLNAEFPDRRFKYVPMSEDQSIAVSRNKLLHLAQGKYIAWLDADDTMLEERIELQVDFLEKHPNIDILGTWIYGISDKRQGIYKAPIHHEEISTHLWYRNCMFQPTVMSRNFYVQENIFYDTDFANSSEDYDLWYRLKSIKTFANLPQALLIYNISTGEDLEKKRKQNQYHLNLSKMWKRKWADRPLPINETDKNDFEQFIYINFNCDNISKKLLNIFELIDQNSLNDYEKLLIDFHRLRLWKNLSWKLRIVNLNLLFRILKMGKMKSAAII